MTSSNQKINRERPSLVQKAFNNLSSIPYLKGLMIGGWCLVAFVRGIGFLMAYSQGKWGEIPGISTREFLFFIIGHSICACLLYYWDKNDRQKGPSK